MDIRLLKMGTREGLGKCGWIVPGYGNAAKILPGRLSVFKTMEAKWPGRHPVDGDEIIHGARLDWHRKIVKAEIKKLIAECRKAKRAARKQKLTEG